MGPTQTKETKNPPMVSSSEEEEEVSGSFADESREESESSGEEESGSFAEESREESDSSGEEDGQEKPIQTDVVVPLAIKPVQESHVSVHESSTDDEAKKKLKRSHKQVKKLDTDDEAKKKMKRLKTEATDEDNSGDDDEAKKKTKRTRKVAIEEEVPKMSEKETLFQRLFSEEDELALLQGIIDFASTRGDPFKDTDGFCDFVKQLISSDATKTQLLNKVRKLEVKFGDTEKRSLEKGKGGEDKILFSKDFEQKAFELSRKIWGAAGVLASKPRKIKEESEKPEINVASSPLSSGREMVSLFKDANLTSFGLDESYLLAHWNMVGDGPKKRAIEEKLKRIKAMKVELCLKRTEILADAANVIFKGVNASSSGDGSKNREVCLIAVKEEKDICVEQSKSSERNMEEISALSLADRKQDNPEEFQDTEMEEKEVDVVSGDANIEMESVAFVTMPVIKKEDFCVASRGIKEGSGSNPLVSMKKLLVLDINGLLASIVSPLPDYKADINIGGKAVFKRPFCQDFLKFCFKNFEVGIWSSRKQKNVERITKFLFGDMKSKLLFCWDMSYCATTSVKSLENRHKPVVFKDLNKLWEKHDQELPWQKGDYNETNTVLLDDSPYKALLNPPYTAIFPHSYDHQNKTDTSLGNGGDLRLYLEKLVEAENVQDFIKNPFGQEAITESSDTWEFYSQAIRTLV